MIYETHFWNRKLTTVTQKEGKGEEDRQIKI